MGALVDTRGRLFGAVNLVDLALTLCLVLTVALGIAAYRTFEIPNPAIDRVEPATVIVGKGSTVRIIGQRFRRYLEAFVVRADAPPAATPLGQTRFEVAISAVTDNALELQLPDLSPGLYDLYLSDNAKQVAYQRAALSIVPVPLPQAAMRIVVRVVVPREAVAEIHLGDQDHSAPAPATIEKIDVRPEQVQLVELRVARRLADDHYLWVGQHDGQAVVDLTLRVPVVAGAHERWQYQDRPVRAGDEFPIETSTFKGRGIVIARGEAERR